MSVTVLNTTASLSGKTLQKLEDSQTITGLKTFDRGASAPFAVLSGSAKVDYLNCDLLDGETGADYHDATLLTGTIPDARFPSTLPALNGSLLTNLNGTAIATGTVAVARGGTGGSATPTQGGINYGTGTAHAFSSAGTAGQQVISGGTGAPTFLNPPLILKKGNSGSTSSAVAENVDTYAFSAAELTANDTIIVHVTGEAVTQDTASVNLRNNTDSVTIVDVWDSGLGAMGAGRENIMTLVIRQLQSAATAVMASGTGANDNAAAIQTGAASTFVTNWTGAWTLALRQGGVTAGGTFKWSWSVYVLKGQ